MSFYPSHASRRSRFGGIEAQVGCRQADSMKSGAMGRPGDRAPECRASSPYPGDAGAGEDDDAGWQDVEHAVVALEGRGLAVAAPVGLEGDLPDLAVIGVAGSGLPGAAPSFVTGLVFASSCG